MIPLPSHGSSAYEQPFPAGIRPSAEPISRSPYEAVLKLLFLVLNLATKEWKMPAREWTAAKAQFAILFEDRFATL